MATLSEVMVRLSLDMRDFNRQMNDVSSRTRDIGRSFQSTGQTMTTALSVPLGLIGAGVIKMGAEFEATMSKVKAMTGANSEEMSKLQAKAMDLGSTTKYSASEVAEGMTFLGQAGFKTNDILASMEGMLNLASAGGLGLAEASDIASNVLTGFGLSADQAGHMADVLALASANSNTNVQQLGDAMKYLAPTAKSLGWNLEDTTSAVMALSDAGIQGEMAGAAFSTSLTNLTKDGSPASKLMKELGINVFDAQGKMKPLPAVIGEIEKATDGMTQKQKASTISTLFGAEAYKHWSVLLDKGSDGLEKNSQALQKADGSAKQMATTMNDNLKGAWDGFTSALETVAIQIYQQFQPALTSIVEKATQVVQWFSNLNASTQKTIAIIGLIVGAIGPVILVLGLLINFVASVISSFGLIVGAVGKVISIFNRVRTAMNLTTILASITSPVGIIIASIVALIAVAVLIWKNWDTIKAKTIEIWGNITEFLSTTWESIKSGVSSFMDTAKQKFSDGWQKVKEKTSEIFDSIIDFIVTWGTRLLSAIPIVAIVTFIVQHWQQIKDKTVEIFNAVVDFIVTWATRLLSITPIGLFVQFIIKNWDTIKETTAIVFEMIKALIQVAFNTIKSVVGTVVSFIASKISTAWNAIKSVTSTVFNAVKSVVTSVWNSIKAVVAPVVDSIKSKVTTVWNSIKSTTSSVFNAVKSVASSVWNSIKSVVSSVASAVGSAVSKAWNQIKSTTSSIFNSVKSVVSSVWNSIKSVVTSVASAIWSAISSKFNQIKSTVTSVFNSIKSTATSVWNGIKSTITSVASSIHSSVSSTFNKVKSAMEKPINSAKNTIKSAVDKIKSFFSNMKLTIPKPKIPKIDVEKASKSIGGVEVPYPKFSVSWNAKGGIFNGASLLGGGQGVGEAGAEAVLPIQNKRYMKPFSNAVAGQLDKINSTENSNTDNGNSQVVYQININGDVRDKSHAEALAIQLERMRQREVRGKGGTRQ
jgi:TP901 family phage tail tape measure protein